MSLLPSLLFPHIPLPITNSPSPSLLPLLYTCRPTPHPLPRVILILIMIMINDLLLSRLDWLGLIPTITATNPPFQLSTSLDFCSAVVGMAMDMAMASLVAMAPPLATDCRITVAGRGGCGGCGFLSPSLLSLSSSCRHALSWIAAFAYVCCLLLT